MDWLASHPRSRLRILCGRGCDTTSAPYAHAPLIIATQEKISPRRCGGCEFAYRFADLFALALHSCTKVNSSTMNIGSIISLPCEVASTRDCSLRPLNTTTNIPP